MSFRNICDTIFHKLKQARLSFYPFIRYFILPLQFPLLRLSFCSKMKSAQTKEIDAHYAKPAVISPTAISLVSSRFSFFTFFFNYSLFARRASFLHLKFNFYFSKFFLLLASYCAKKNLQRFFKRSEKLQLKNLSFFYIKILSYYFLGGIHDPSLG